jgi:hypothetical protein
MRGGPVPRARRSDDTDARHSQDGQGTDREHPQAGSYQTAEDDPEGSTVEWVGYDESVG